METMIVWDLVAGIQIVRIVESVLSAHNAHAGLAGSVMQNGFSAKDLDIVVYPHKGPPPDQWVEELILKLEAIGFLPFKRRWHTEQGCNKKVYMTHWEGKRVDFFFLS